MKKIGLILFFLGIVWGGIMLWLKPYTGYMDADYYYSVASNLFTGKGFEDYLLWNYLTDPVQIPIPAASYWMPAATVPAYLGMLLFGQDTLFAARIPFILLFALSSSITALVSWSVFRNKTYALASGGLVLLSGYYLKFVSVPDGFTILFICGAGLVFLLHKRNEFNPLLFSAGMGIVCGIIHMTRADGLLWFFLAAGFVFFQLIRSKMKYGSSLAWKVIAPMVLFAGGYLFISGWWYYRNWQYYGSLMPHGGLRGLWLTAYKDLFIYPAQVLTAGRWLDSGVSTILLDRLKAIGLNLITFIAVGGLIFLIPGLIPGIKAIEDQAQRRFWYIGFGLVFLIMSIVFPYAGARGGFLHSLAIIQPFLWMILPVGISRFIQSVVKNRISPDYSEGKIVPGILIIAFIISIFLIINDRQQPPAITQANLWQEYLDVNQLLISDGASTDQGVIVANPAAYYAGSQRTAIMIPTGDSIEIVTLSKRFHAPYLIVSVYSPPEYEELLRAIESKKITAKEIGTNGNLRVYKLEPDL